METFLTPQIQAPVCAQPVQNEVCTEPAAKPAKQKRGFAILNQEKRQQIARQGGKLAHALGRAHKFTAEEARLAGKKGGLARRKRTKQAS